MSLRGRLLVVILVLLAVYLATAALIVSTQRSQLIGQVDKRLLTLPPEAFPIIDHLPPAEFPDERPVAVPLGPDEPANPFSDFSIAVVDAAGNVTLLLAAGLIGGMPDFRAALAAARGSPRPVTIGAIGDDDPSRFRAVVAPRPGGDSWIVAAQSLAEIDAAIARLIRTLWIAGAFIALVLGVAFVWVQRLGLRPIARVTAAATAIAAGDRSHRVPVGDGRTEADKLGTAFNLMLDERDLADARLRQFVADASHELRTPLTSIRGYLELYRQGAFQEGAQLDDVVRRLSAESARMFGLVEDLLVLASLDEGRPLRDDDVDLGQLLRDAAQDARAVQGERPITVTTPPRGPRVTGDSSRLVQLVGILVSNALAHTPVSTPVVLTAASEPARAVIVIADQGPGLDPGSASRVFDRFWRGEVSRARVKRAVHGGGAGLGLAIARSIVEAHGGTIALTTAPGEGCSFAVTLPFKRPAENDSRTACPSPG